jgi:hypothetical protein
MTPKEMAQDLVAKMENPSEGFTIVKYAAKQLALISLEFSKEFITGDLSEAFDKFLFIEDIKQEIEKL